MQRTRSVGQGRFAIFVAALCSFVIASAAPAQSCPGDCNGDGSVSIAELIRGVSISLGNQDISQCPSFDLNADGEVRINELISAVNASLEGCPEVELSCSATSIRCIEIAPGAAAEEAILTALIEARPGDEIFLQEGLYELEAQLSLTDVPGVTFSGAGMDRTIVSFANQAVAGEGFLVAADEFTLQNLTLQDAPGDIFKIVGSRQVTIRGVKAEWTRGPNPDNGAYALYPVECEDVLMEDNVVIGASDAGIYLGQSMNAIVRRNRVEQNVIGIEVENSFDVDVYENVATGNTSGVLVITLPNLPVKDGRRTRVYDNQIVENNIDNFAPGGVATAIPPGSGLLIVNNDEVEVFGNTFRDNKTLHVSVLGFNTVTLLTDGEVINNDPQLDSYSESIYLHDNSFEGGGDDPAPQELREALIALAGELPLPNILVDGDVDMEKLVAGELPAELRTCIQEDAATTMINLGFGVGLPPSEDPAVFDCTLDPLPPVVLLRDEPCLGATGACVVIEPGPNAQDDLLTALIDAGEGDTIYLAEGTYDFDMPMSLNGVDGVTLRGAGMDRTVVSFAGQTSGGQGILVQANDFTIEDITLQDSPADLIKFEGANGVTIRRVKTEWSGGSDPGNGAYALYPVQSENILIERSIAIAASDAGLYVGQSKNIVIRHCRAEANVAGIEIENSQDADVYENVAVNNTAGILVFNLPGLPVKDGRRTRVFRNEIIENNTPNFAPGGIVQTVPPGTGLLINANDEVEVFENDFVENQGTQVAVISYNTAVLLGAAASTDPEFDPYSESIYFLNNNYVGGGDDPQPQELRDFLVALLTSIGETLPVPNLVVDGDVDVAKFVGDELPAELRTCIRENDATVINLGLGGGTGNLSTDPAYFDCTLARLPAVVLP
jgi:parallel beta-helix repeat protein